MIEFIQILSLVIFILLSLFTAYIFLFAIAAKLYRSNKYSETEIKSKIAVLIPAYREDKVILKTVEACIAQNYPDDKYEVFVGAHHLSDETISELKKHRVNVVMIEEQMGSKALSLQKIFLSNKQNDFDIALILDADNIMKKDCLQKINHAFHQGFRGVQLHRTAKNLNTNIALLDAISEEINNTIFRKGQRALGFSASTIGSGMAFNYDSLKKIYLKPGIVDNPACDREVEFDQIIDHVIIEYIDDSYILDEKVQDLSSFSSQRTRWNESQLWHIRKFFQSIIKEKSNKQFWNKFFQNIIPSRFILSLAIVLLLIASVVFELNDINVIRPATIFWIILFIIYHFTLYLSIPGFLKKKKYLISFLYLPLVAFHYIKALFKMKPGRKEFIHTKKHIS
jgi:cellulose synthase/poly-beta-1,6-N-acetylglucosamine synthase-like glycosyltransferase